MNRTPKTSRRPPMNSSDRKRGGGPTPNCKFPFFGILPLVSFFFAKFFWAPSSTTPIPPQKVRHFYFAFKPFESNIGCFKRSWDWVSPPFNGWENHLFPKHFNVWLPSLLNNITIAGLILEVVTFWRLTSTLMFSLTLCKALSFQSLSAIEMAR